MSNPRHIKEPSKISETPQDASPNGPSWIKFILAIVAFIAITIGQIFPTLLVPAFFPGDPLMKMAASKIAVAILPCLAVLLLGARKWLGCNGESIAYVFRVGWILLLIPIVPSIHTVYQLVTGAVTVDSGVFGRLASVVIMCLGIGIFEEVLFRGVVLNGLLSVAGGSRRGIMAAAILSSLMFGYTHVTRGDFEELLTAVQAILKMLQTGMLGVVMADAALHSRKLGAVSLFHALNDALFMASSIAVEGGELATSYSMSGDTGYLLLLVYGAMIAVSVLPTYWSVRRIWNERDVDYGAFV